VCFWSISKIIQQNKFHHNYSCNILFCDTKHVVPLDYLTQGSRERIIIRSYVTHHIPSKFKNIRKVALNMTTVVPRDCRTTGAWSHDYETLATQCVQTTVFISVSFFIFRNVGKSRYLISRKCQKWVFIKIQKT